jgi:hypothetical protein
MGPETFEISIRFHLGLRRLDRSDQLICFSPWTLCLCERCFSSLCLIRAARKQAVIPKISHRGTETTEKTS